MPPHIGSTAGLDQSFSASSSPIFMWRSTHVTSLAYERRGGFPGWCYTVGLSDVLGCPELIVIGLKPSMAHSLLNECARRLQQGLRVGERERVDGLLSNVECEFRTSEKRRIKQTMVYAVWYNRGDEFAVLQCVYLISTIISVG